MCVSDKIWVLQYVSFNLVISAPLLQIAPLSLEHVHLVFDGTASGE